jgi:hypothetical protein
MDSPDEPPPNPAESSPTRECRHAHSHSLHLPDPTPSCEPAAASKPFQPTPSVGRADLHAPLVPGRKPAMREAPPHPSEQQLLVAAPLSHVALTKDAVEAGPSYSPLPDLSSSSSCAPHHHGSPNQNNNTDTFGECTRPCSLSFCSFGWFALSSTLPVCG